MKLTAKELAAAKRILKNSVKVQKGRPVFHKAYIFDDGYDNNILVCDGYRAVIYQTYDYDETIPELDPLSIKDAEKLSSGGSTSFGNKIIKWINDMQKTEYTHSIYELPDVNALKQIRKACKENNEYDVSQYGKQILFDISPCTRVNLDYLIDLMEAVTPSTAWYAKNAEKATALVLAGSSYKTGVRKLGYLMPVYKAPDAPMASGNRMLARLQAEHKVNFEG